MQKIIEYIYNDEQVEAQYFVLDEATNPVTLTGEIYEAKKFDAKAVQGVIANLHYINAGDSSNPITPPPPPPM